MTGSASSPIVKIISQNDPSKIWDISGIINNITIGYGRNQPFQFAEIEVKRTYFNSITTYWSGIPGTPTDSGGNIILPSTILEDGLTPIQIEAYGQAYSMCIERHESDVDNDIITLLCYNHAYKLKSQITFDALCSIVMSSTGSFYLKVDSDLNTRVQLSVEVRNNKKVPYIYMGDNNTDKVQFVSDFNTPTWNSTTEYQEGQCVVRSSVYYVALERNTGKNPASYSSIWSRVTSDLDINILYVEGTGTALFKYMAVKGAGYQASDCVCDIGYSYDYTKGGAYGTVQQNYTLDDIDQIKSMQVLRDNNPSTLKLRVNTGKYCWDILKSLGASSNRWPFFYDKAYFVDYYTDAMPNNNKVYSMNLDYGVDENYNVKTYINRAEGSSPEYLNCYEIVANADQGSTYVQTSQRVYSENYSRTIHISDAKISSKGYDIYFPYPEAVAQNDPQQNQNGQRNFETARIAFNRIVANYKPLDAIQFTISEINGRDQAGSVQGHAYKSVQDLPQSAPEGTYALVITQYALYDYYKFTNGSWVQDDTAQDMNDRLQVFNPYTSVLTVNDAQNGLEMENVPLAYTLLMWPSCLTQLTFGNPEFMDAQQQWSSLTLEAQVSSEQGTEDANITDSYASKIVVGNKTMQELGSSRSDFTGLIMEKNLDTGVYRLAGYNNGVVQASFNSEGKIVSGDGSSGKVTIDQNGINIAQGGGTIDPSIIPTPALEWVDTKTYSTGQCVTYEGKMYRSAKDNNTGHQPDENIYNPDTGAGWWILTIDTPTSEMEWSQEGNYDVGDAVYYGGYLYTALKRSGPGMPAPTTDVEWSSSVSYSINNTVKYQDSIYEYIPYKSLTDNNFNHIPPESPDYWEMIPVGPITPGSTEDVGYWRKQSLDGWSPTTSYIKGNIVAYNGVMYTAIDQSGDPPIEPGVNSVSDTYWKAGIKYEVGSTGAYVVLDNNGLKTYNGQSANPVCQVDSNGNITGITVSASQISVGSATADKIQANQIDCQGVVDQATVTTRQLLTPYVDIDSSGLRTYNSTSHIPDNLQCQVGSDGQVSAGQGYVKLNKSGLSIYTQSATSTSNTYDQIKIYDASGSSTIVGKMAYRQTTLSGISGGSDSTYSKTYKAVALTAQNISSTSSVGSALILEQTSSGTSRLQLTSDGVIYYSSITGSQYQHGLIVRRWLNHDGSGGSGNPLIMTATLYEDGFLEIEGNVSYSTTGPMVTTIDLTIWFNVFSKPNDSTYSYSTMTPVYASCTTARNVSSNDGRDYVCGNNSGSIGNSTMIPTVTSHYGSTYAYLFTEQGAGAYFRFAFRLS